GSGLYPSIEAIRPDWKEIATTIRDSSSSQPLGATWALPLPPPARESGPEHIYISELDSISGKVKGPAAVLSETVQNCSPAWSPDGKFMAFKKPGPVDAAQPQISRLTLGVPFQVVIRSLDTAKEEEHALGLGLCRST